jgi:hypothetical protein
LNDLHRAVTASINAPPPPRPIGNITTDYVNVIAQLPGAVSDNDRAFFQSAMAGLNEELQYTRRYFSTASNATGPTFGNESTDNAEY